MQLSSNIFRSKKAHWKKGYYTPYSTNEERLEHGPDELSAEEWVNLLSFWSTPEQKTISERNKLNKSKQHVKHTSGRKSFSRRRAELANKSNGTPPSEGEFFIKTHINKVTQEPLDDVSRNYIEQMQQEAGIDEEGNKRPITNEIYKKVMPPERHGRVRLWGPLATPTIIFGFQASSSASSLTQIQNLKEQLFETTTEIANFKRKLQDNDEEMERHSDQNKAEMKRRLKEQKEEMERRFKEREEEMKRRVMRKVLAMMGGEHQSHLDNMEECS